MNKKKVIIIGAAGRDFHNFNTYFRATQVMMLLLSLPLRFRILMAENIQKSLQVMIYTQVVFQFTLKQT